MNNVKKSKTSLIKKRHLEELKILQTNIIARYSEASNKNVSKILAFKKRTK